MTTGIQSEGLDLDSLFKLYVSGTHPGTTGIKSAGTDINTRYQPLSGTPQSATGILCKVGGAGSLVDLNTLFSPPSSRSVSARPTSVSGSTVINNHVATTSNCTATAIGFSSPTFAWSRVSGDMGATFPSAATTAFSGIVGDGTINPTSRTSVWKCTVTDGSGSLDTNHITAEVKFL